MPVRDRLMILKFSEMGGMFLEYVASLPVWKRSFPV